MVLVLLAGGVGSGLLCSAGRPLVDAQQAQPHRIPSKGTVPLASGALRDAVAKIERGESAGEGVDVVGDAIRVEVIHTLSTERAQKIVAKHGGVIEGEIEGLVQALVPVDELVPLEGEPGVRYLRPPLNVSIPIDPPRQVDATRGSVAGGAIVGQEVAKTNADDWHAAGFTGAGVKIGIIDGFDQTLWNAAQSAGEVPSPSGTLCRFIGVTLEFWFCNSGILGTSHGVGVAEIIHEMAPDAQLYLATVLTTTDLQAAVDYFDAQGVNVISRSLTSPYDGPGNGTGPMATVIDNAVADGMTWFNSGGNGASD